MTFDGSAGKHVLPERIRLDPDLLLDVVDHSSGHLAGVPREPRAPTITLRPNIDNSFRFHQGGTMPRPVPTVPTEPTVATVAAG
ncbi:MULTISPECIES: hypothetical protein [unclassified Frankia]|uniref:hypothetical protein n=1 Tax=unclassified Frankia TaxID=2632575 RepID=UPI0020253089